MPVKKKPATDIKPVVYTETKKRSVYIQWDILFKKTATKESRKAAIDELLSYVGKQITSKTKGIALEYDTFKSETNKLLYVFRMYEQAPVPQAPSKKTTASRDAGDIKENTMSGPAIALSGPIHPPGPPNQIPPGIESIDTD